MKNKEPKKEQLKARLAAIISKDIKTRGWTQVKAAEYLGVSQGEISNISTSKFKYLSIYRLLSLTVKLGFKVEIHINDWVIPVGVEDENN